jgi:cytidylate kinase
MRITLSGDLGSGKSTVGKRLSERLGVPHISTGRLFREIGQISNMDALRTNLAAEDNAEIDALVDGKIKEIDQSVADFVIDSRMAWHFVAGAAKVFLSVRPETAVQRIMADGTRGLERYADRASALRALTERRNSEIRRYRRLYDVDIEDPANYDLIIITDDADAEDIVEIILAYGGGRTRHKHWIPKTRLVPMIPVGDAAHSKPSRLSPDAEFEVPLHVKQNFGFFFDDAADLAAAFQYRSSLVPYRLRTPAALPASGGDPLELAKSALSRSALREWEKLGRTPLAFLDHMPEKAH